jgi:cell division protein FtsB
MRRKAKLPLVLLGSLALAVYFAHHALTGSHGFQARQKLIERASMLDREIGRLDAVRTRLRRDVALLTPDKPDADMVAIIAADVLGYVPADAVVIAPASR